jgi:signal transduction histidine kinase
MEAQEGKRMGGADGGQQAGEPALVAAAAGELNAPLVLLRQLSLALADQGLSASERQKLTERMTLTAERALRITRRLSFHSDAPQLLALEPVNAVTLCQEVVHELAPLFKAHGHAIAVQPRSKIPLLIADRELLRRVLVGFGDNALHYGSDKHPVRLTIAQHDNHVRVGVRDYGPAVPTDIWQRLEGRIQRRSVVPLARRPQTSGVGLIAARKLTEMMGGTIGVIRHRDGATFYVDMRVSGQMSLL